MTLSLAPFSLHPACPSPVDGVSRLAYFNIRLGGPPGRQINWHTWQVPGSQEAQSAAVPLLLWPYRYWDGETSVSRLSRGGVLRIVAEIFRWNFCRIVRQRTTRCREIFPPLRGGGGGLTPAFQEMCAARSVSERVTFYTVCTVEIKLKQNSLKTVSKQFWNRFELFVFQPKQP